jgi:hypothetical protein
MTNKKKKNTLADVYCSDMFGTRKNKFITLGKNNKWTKAKALGKNINVDGYTSTQANIYADNDLPLFILNGSGEITFLKNLSSLLKKLHSYF